CSTYYHFPILFSHCSRAHTDLHSFPTRRSSDLYPVTTHWMSEIVVCRSRLKVSSATLTIVVSRIDMIVPMITTSEIRQTCLSIRSEEHTSELQSLTNIVCRLLLAKKKNNH